MKRPPKVRVRQEWRTRLKGRRLKFWVAVAKDAKARGIASTKLDRIVSLARRRRT